jgi:hypothetical protein
VLVVKTRREEPVTFLERKTVKKLKRRQTKISGSHLRRPTRLTVRYTIDPNQSLVIQSKYFPLKQSNMRMEKAPYLH